jgi:hypothetical protein
MKPPIALLALFVVACGGGESTPGPTGPGPTAPTDQVDGGQYYDPRSNQWIRLRDMPIPVHGVYGSAFVDGLIWAPGGGTHIGGNFGSLLTQVFSPTVSCE